MERSLKNIWIITLANGFSAFGNQFQFLAITSLTYAVTGSPIITSLQMVVHSIPYILTARWTGRVVDKCDPRTVIAAATITQALLTLLYIFGYTSVAVILGLNFLVSTMGAFARPAQSALFPLLVGKDNLMRGNARKSVIMGVVQLFGPAIAGWAIVRIGTTWAFTLNSISYLFPAGAMCLVRLVDNRKTLESPSGGSTAKGSMAGGAVSTFLRERPSFVVVLIAHGGFMLGMWAVNSLYYPYTSDVLGRGPEVLGLFTSAYFGASLVVGIALEHWGNGFKGNRQLLTADSAGAAIWMAYTLLPSVGG